MSQRYSTLGLSLEEDSAKVISVEYFLILKEIRMLDIIPSEGKI